MKRNGIDASFLRRRSGAMHCDAKGRKERRRRGNIRAWYVAKGRGGGQGRAPTSSRIYVNTSPVRSPCDRAFLHFGVQRACRPHVRRPPAVPPSPDSPSPPHAATTRRREEEERSRGCSLPLSLSLSLIGHARSPAGLSACCVASLPLSRAPSRPTTPSLLPSSPLPLFPSPCSLEPDRV